MEDKVLCRTAPVRPGNPNLWRFVSLGYVVLFFLAGALPAVSQAQRPTASEATPEPAVSTILAAFDKYEVVAMPEAHGMKDVDDFILSLIRDPNFP